MAARFCPQCQQEVSSTARFCPNCASQIADMVANTVAPPVQPATTVIYPVHTSPSISPTSNAIAHGRTALIVTMAIGLIISLTVILLLTSRPRPAVITSAQAQPSSATPVVASPVAPSPGTPSVVTAPTTPGAATAPVTSAPSTLTGSLPADADSYVKFLQGIDQRRIALDSDTDSANAMLGVAHEMQSNSQTPDPEQASNSSNTGVSKISSGFGGYSQKWQNLIRDFTAVPPPDSCLILASSYHRFLTDYADSVTKLQVALLNNDISGAMQLQGAQKNIDVDGVQADTDLTNLCNRYDARKPFSISTGGTSPSLITQ